MSRRTMMTVGSHITMRFQPTQKTARLKRDVMRQEHMPHEPQATGSPVV
jgi:hypothetical protein